MKREHYGASSCCLSLVNNMVIPAMRRKALEIMSRFE